MAFRKPARSPFPIPTGTRVRSNVSRWNACFSGLGPAPPRLWSKVMPSIRFSLPDNVVVTGTASGLGLEVGRLLLAQGCRVVGVDTATSELEGRAGYQQVTASIAE